MNHFKILLMKIHASRYDLRETRTFKQRLQFQLVGPQFNVSEKVW